MTSDESVRLFVGVRVSLETVASLIAGAKELRAKAGNAEMRWVSPATYHVTLKFLGWQHTSIIEGVRDRVGEALAGQRMFKVSCEGVGAFPSAKEARVLWAGMGEGAERLAPMAEKIDVACSTLGFVRETRPFHAHVTLGRLKKAADVSKVLFADKRVFGTTVIDSILLYESKIKSAGSGYIVHHEWKLSEG